ncbi:MAG: tetratricopeptide repeat protein [Anaerolineales bacterium]
MVKQKHNFEPSAFQTFGELLKYLRERAHLSQRELAEQVGYHYSYMSRLENNVRMPDEASIRTRFIPALRIQQDPAWAERLLELATEASAKESIVETQSNSNIGGSGALPIPLTPLLGRDSKSDQLYQILSASQSRLVTLIGPPGVGKTRLSLHVAEHLSTMFKDGVIFVDLMPISDSEQVIPALAAALGTQETSEASTFENVKAALHERNMLIVMDNFEQVLDAATELASLLAAAPAIKILATSREALRLRGEQEFPLDPLDVPNGENSSVLDFPAVQLFLQRARAAQPDFSLGEEDASRVAEICRRLDGLPLAIELAAARIRSFSLADMLDQFDRRFQWLALTARDIPEWRRTLWSAIAWSYNLLTEHERNLFERLSVFSGGWTVEAAEIVCADEQDCPRAEILPMLLQLVDKSLVVREANARYRFLDTIGKFAHEKLIETGKLDEISRCYVLYFSNWAETLEKKYNLIGRNQFQIQTGREQNNIRAALDWALSHEENYIDGLRLAIPANLIWLEHGQIREEYERAQAFLRKAIDPTLAPLQIRLLLRTAALGLRIGRGSLAYRYCKKAESMARTINDKSLLASALLMVGDMERDSNRFDEAEKSLSECIKLYRELNMLPELSQSLSSIGNNLFHQGKTQEADIALDEAIQIAEEIQDAVGLGNALRVRATNLRFAKKYRESLQAFQYALDVARESGDRPNIGINLANLCLLSNLLEEYATSGIYAAEAVSVFQSLGDEDQQAFPKRMQAYALLHQGFPSRAKKLALESLNANLQNEIQGIGTFGCLIALTEINLAEGKVEEAAKIHGYVKNHINEQFLSDSPDTHALARNESQFENKDVQTWQAEGSSMFLEKIVELVSQN